jgi:hypothetical protein
MALIPLTIQPGVWLNGTAYQARGRYYGSNLVRWYDQTLRPWGGWGKFTPNALSGVPRGMIAWVDQTGLLWVMAGSASKLMILDSGGLYYDITPTGFTVGITDATNIGGYGGNTYGNSTYGNARGSSSMVTPATVWTLDTLEQTPIACCPGDGFIYQWDLNTAHLATKCPNSPINCRASFVTQEGFIFALGANGDPRNIMWPDQSSTSNWTPSDVAQAGSYAIQTPGRLVCGCATRSGSLIWTTTDVHLATYQGLPIIYSFNQLGSECGIISPLAFATAEGAVYWMGPNGFWKYDGSVQPLESDVWDYLFKNLNVLQRSKTWALHNGYYGEVMWFYPSNAGTEIDSYVTYNYREGHWAVGLLARTSGVQQGVLNNPIMAAPTGFVWSHELTVINYQGEGTPYAETGPLEFDSTYVGDVVGGNHPGDRTFDIVQLIPDALTLGDVTATFYTRFYPTGPETTWGPYAMANPTSVRISGRQARMRLTGANNTDWRIGIPRIDFRPAGNR